MSADPLLNRLQSVVYPARDLPASRRFWATALGREPTFETEDYASFDIDGQELALSRLPWVDEPLVFWSVTDLVATHRALTQAGARTMVQVADGSLAEQGTATAVAGVDSATGAVEVPGGLLAVLRTPGGDLVGLHQQVEGSW